MSDTDTLNRVWPAPLGFMRAIKSAFTVGKIWKNIAIQDFQDIVGACLHDPNVFGDTIYIEITFSTDTNIIESFELMGAGSEMTCLDAYNFNGINEFIDHVILPLTNKCLPIVIACQLYGDFWVARRPGENCEYWNK